MTTLSFARMGLRYFGDGRTVGGGNRESSVIEVKKPGSTADEGGECTRALLSIAAERLALKMPRQSKGKESRRGERGGGVNRARIKKKRLLTREGACMFDCRNSLLCFRSC